MQDAVAGHLCRVAQLALGVQHGQRIGIAHAVQFAVSLGIGRAGQDAADVEQVAAGPDQRALQRNAFHADRAGKADVGLEHAVAVQIAQFHVAEARMAILQGIGRIAQQVVELLVEQVEPLLAGAKAAKYRLPSRPAAERKIDEELFLAAIFALGTWRSACRPVRSR